MYVEKSRRLVVSWVFCALDVWDSGLRKCNIVQGAIDYKKASGFVWRCYFIYNELRKAYPHWNLAEGKTWGNALSEELDQFALPNDSLIEGLNSNGESFRGDGYTRVKLEELSSYRYIAKVVAQARAVTQGPPGMVGGQVVAVCNSSPAPEWQDIKKSEEPLPSTASEPYLEYISDTGNQIIRVHFSCDPLKDEDWVADNKKGWSRTEWLREMELHDKEVEGALWTQKLIDDNRVWELPLNITQVLVSVDPSVTDPEKAKNPSKKPDETGIIIGMISDDLHGYVVADKSGDLSPMQWAREVVTAYSLYRANRVIAEGNQGGELVELTIHQISPMVPVQRIHARHGKRIRAEPIAAAYELGHIHHVGILDGLELEMTTWDSKTNKKSPGRIDAMCQLFKASGLIDALAGGVAERFESENNEPEFFIPPEAEGFYPLSQPATEYNPFAPQGWT